jgi:hypothetical protein
MIPCTDRSNALGFQVLGVAPYKGFVDEGTWLREKRDGRSGA